MQVLTDVDFSCGRTRVVKFAWLWVLCSPAGQGVGGEIRVAKAKQENFKGGADVSCGFRSSPVLDFWMGARHTIDKLVFVLCIRRFSELNV